MKTYKPILVFLLTLISFNLISQQPTTHKYVTEFGIRGNNDGEIKRALDVCLDSEGYVYVADKNNERIQKYSPAPNFTFITSITNTEIPTLSSRDFRITIDANNNVFIAVKTGSNDGVIYKYDSDLTFQYGVYNSSGDFGPQGLCVDLNGNILIANDNDVEDNVIKLANNLPAGAPLSIFAEQSNGGDNSVKNPSDVVVNTNGNIYISDTGRKVIKVFDSNENYLFKMLDDVIAPVSVDDIGTNTADIGPETVEFDRFDDMGDGPEFDEDDIATEAIEPENLGKVSGVALDQIGMVYATSRDMDRVYILTQDGEFLSQIGDTEGKDDYLFNKPNEIFSTPSGKIYVADQANHRIVIYAVTPDVESATTSADGLSVSITFNVDMEAPSVGDGGYEFTIIAGGSELPIASISQPSPKVYTFLLNAPVQPGQSVTINFGEEAAPSALSVNSISVNPVTSTDGATLDPFSSAFNVTNSVVSPQAVSVKTNAMGTKLYVTFNQDLQDPLVDVLPSLTFSGMTNSVTAIAKQAGSDDILELTLDSYISYGQSGINLQYPGGTVTGYLRNTPGVFVDAFDLPITNMVPTPPTVVSATIREGSQILILTFNQDMTDIGANYSDFTVDITGNSPNNPQGGYFPGSSTKPNVIALTLDHPIGDDATGGTVNYIEGTGYFAANGARLATFSQPFQIQIMPKVPLANWGIGLLVFLIIGTIVFIKRR